MNTLKITIAIAILLLLTPSISNAQESTLEFENAASITTIVKKYIAALQKGNVATMNAQLSKDVMVRGLGGGLDSLNFKQHKEYYKESTSNYVHTISGELYLPVKVTDNWNEGEWVLVWGTNTVTNKKSGVIIPIPFHIAILVANGKISQMYYFYDMLNIISKEGWTITPPKK
ncbi:MAG: hypothetical protein COB12_01870 [Flavobacterium sp.]|nr:MAG: hypothetical protein COB12_01870 [Flavobacterium sp.]